MKKHFTAIAALLSLIATSPAFAKPVSKQSECILIHEELDGIDTFLKFDKNSANQKVRNRETLLRARLKLRKCPTKTMALLEQILAESPYSPQRNSLFQELGPSVYDNSYDHAYRKYQDAVEEIYDQYYTGRQTAPSVNTGD